MSEQMRGVQEMPGGFVDGTRDTEDGGPNAITPMNAADAAPQSETSAVLGLIERAARDASIDIDKLQRLLELRTQIQIKEAETAFDMALTDAQSEMRRVAPDSNNAQTRSRYASYAALDRALRPIYTKHGFSLSFNTAPDAAEQCVRVLCRVSKGGYSREYQIDMPADGKGAKGGDVMTRTHATGSAVSYGSRYLLKMIFNVAIGDDDDDGNAAGRRGQQQPIVSEASPVKPEAVAPPPPHDPHTGEVGPRALPLPEADTAWRSYIAWGGQYIAAVNAAATASELDEWGAANHAMLKEIKEKAPKIFERIGPNIEAARAKLIAAAAKPPTSSKRSKKAAPTPAQPEEYLTHIATTLAACNTPATLMEVWNEKFLPTLGDLFPPDAAVAVEMLEARLAKLAQQELAEAE